MIEVRIPATDPADNGNELRWNWRCMKKLVDAGIPLIEVKTLTIQYPSTGKLLVEFDMFDEVVIYRWFADGEPLQC